MARNFRKYYGHKSGYKRVSHGKVFRCKKGKHKGKLVKYAYKNGRKSSKRMVLHRRRRY